LRFGIEAASSAEGMVPSRANIRREGDEAYLFRLSGYVKGNSSINITTVSVIRWQLVISRILSERLADYVALCRPLIRVLSDQPLEQTGSGKGEVNILQRLLRNGTRRFLYQLQSGKKDQRDGSECEKAKKA